MNYAEFGYIRVAAVAPVVSVGNPLANAREAIRRLKDPQIQGASLVVFPELNISGYTCEDLFFNHDMHTRCEQALAQIATATAQQIVVANAGLYPARALI